MAKVMILPDYNGQDLPSEGLERYDHVYLVTEQQDSLPISAVKTLMKLMTTVNIEFLEIPHNSDSEFLLCLAFKVAQMAVEDSDIQVTFVSENIAFDSLVSAAKNNGFRVSRADGFARVTSGPSEVPLPVQPKVVSNKPIPTPQQVESKNSNSSSNNNNNKKSNSNQRLISSLLNGSSSH